MDKQQFQTILVVIFITILNLENSHCDATIDEVNKIEAKFEEIEAELKYLIKLSSDGQVRRTPINTNILVCKDTKLLFDSHGNYLKSICNSAMALNYYEAEKVCFDNGMDLLIIENEDVYDEVSKFALEVFPGLAEVWDHGAGVWINGRLNDTEWYIYKDLKKQEIGKGIKIVKELKHGGDCGVLKRNKTFELRDYNCSQVHAFFCEYQSVM